MKNYPVGTIGRAIADAQPEPAELELCTIARAAEVAGVSVGTIYRRMRAGELRFWRKGFRGPRLVLMPYNDQR